MWCYELVCEECKKREKHFSMLVLSLLNKPMCQYRREMRWSLIMSRKGIL